MSGDIARYADVAMYPAKPLTAEGEEVRPRVTVIDMTARPVQVAAAVAELYRGTVVDDPRAVPRGLAEEWIRGLRGNALPAPLEWVRISLLIEGVSRAFTHQLVRQRTATYVQESLRFAVKDDAEWAVVMPPSIAVLPEDAPARIFWQQSVRDTGRAYLSLVHSGTPAEDARGLLPTNIATRVHYTTDLRNLVAHSGLRLCSQAQYEWKMVWIEILRALMQYGPDEDRWQQAEICRLFAPICYQTGGCEFMGPADRYCVIRERVQAHAANGERPEEWDDIDPHECLHPQAARERK